MTTEVIAEPGQLAEPAGLPARLDPLVRETRARIAAGSAGRVRRVHVAALGGHADAAAAFARSGAELIDLLEFVSGQRVARVTALQRELELGGDLFSALLELGGGAIGTVLVARRAAGERDRVAIEIAGTEGSFRMSREPHDRVNGDDGGRGDRAAGIAAAVLESARTGHWVEVDTGPSARGASEPALAIGRTATPRTGPHSVAR